MLESCRFAPDISHPPTDYTAKACNFKRRNRYRHVSQDFDQDDRLDRKDPRKSFFVRLSVSGTFLDELEFAVAADFGGISTSRVRCLFVAGGWLSARSAGAASFMGRSGVVCGCGVIWKIFGINWHSLLLGLGLNSLF